MLVHGLTERKQVKVAVAAADISAAVITVAVTSLPCSADIPLEAMCDESIDSSTEGQAPWDDVSVTQSQDANMEEETAEPPKQAKEAVKLSSPSQNLAEMEAEASKKGYGKAYAAFGGGREGLEACAASKFVLLLWPLSQPMQPAQSFCMVMFIVQLPA